MTGSQAPLEWLANCESAPSVYWRGRGERSEHAGYEVAYEARLKGADSAQQAVTLAQKLLHRLASIEGKGLSFAPRLFCGFAFDPEHAPEHATDCLWSDFPGAWIVLPRIVCMHEGGRSTWFATLTVRGDSTTDDVCAEADSARERLQAQLNRPMPFSTPAFDSLTGLDGADWWNGRVRELTQRMEEGSLHKVVLSRRFEWRARSAPETWPIVKRLGDGVPGCFVFGFRPGRGPAFIGASPERLFRIRGRMLESECVAGTIGRGSDSDSDDTLAKILLSSRKDNLEHYYVLEDILQALGELCERMDAGTRPRILKLPTLQHLMTTARGELREGKTLADVLTRLHPTPAVGGSPREAAVAAIREMEPASRGWYAGPVGWIGADAAEFAVAIRSATITAMGATVFAGAGIVRGSEPEKEWRETENKARAFVSALESQRL
jgi:menaquinone-specific isochorismate synthase